MSINQLKFALFAVSFAYALAIAQFMGGGHPKLIALLAFGIGVWPCAVIKVFDL